MSNSEAAPLPLKLSLEEQDALEQLVCSDAMMAVFFKLIDAQCGKLEKVVLTYPLDKGPDGLIIVKARCEGARQLQRDLITLTEKVKRVRP